MCFEFRGWHLGRTSKRRMRDSRLADAILVAAAGSLLVTAVAQFVTLLMGGRLLQGLDPLLALPTGWVMAGVGMLELAIAIAVLWLPNRRISCLLITLLGGQFVAYRLAFAIGGFSRGCPCMGRLGEWLSLSDQAMHRLLWFAAFWLFLSGVAGLWLVLRTSSPATTAGCESQRIRETRASGPAQGDATRD